MPSAKFKQLVAATSAGESPVDLIEIAQADLVAPIRFVNDLQDITVQGHLFAACMFDVVRPDDADGVTPQATLKISNVGREMGTVLEDTGGLQGATCRIMQVLRSQPDVIEYDITMGLSALHADMQWVSGTLGFPNTMDIPAVCVRYTPDVAPGLY